MVTILYMDDLITLANSVTPFKWPKSEIEKKSEMHDLEELHYSLGMDFGRNREARIITMNQRNYIEEVLKRFNMEKCKPVETLFDVNSKWLKLSMVFHTRPE